MKFRGGTYSAPIFFNKYITALTNFNTLSDLQLF